MSPTQMRKAARRRAVRRQRILLCSLLLLFVCISVFLLTQCAAAGKTEQPTVLETLPPTAAQTDAPLPALPAGWEWRQTTEAELSRGTLILVNAAQDFDPSLPEVVSVYGNKTDSYLVKSSSLSVQSVVLDALNDWMDAFAAESGKTDVNIIAGWRSLADQTELYDNAVATKGQAHADAYIALPGHSEHHTGLAVDLDTYDVVQGTAGGFDGDGDYAWAVEHAWEYGFIQRYPPAKSAVTGINYESWHFRYVGLPHAWVMQSENLCLEEYLEYLRQYTFFGEHLVVTCLGVRYEIYFCPKDRLVVPTAGSYTLSGNNMDGFIVTIPSQQLP